MSFTAKCLCIAVLVALLPGCQKEALKPTLQITDPEAVRRADSLEICAKYGSTNGVSITSVFGVNIYEATRAELERRQTFTDEEWSQIDNDELVIGMTKCAVLAAHWLPYYNSYQETFAEAVGNNEWVYNFNWYKGDLGLGPETYVYFENDKVVKIAGTKLKQERVLCPLDPLCK